MAAFITSTVLPALRRGPAHPHARISRIAARPRTGRTPAARPARATAPPPEGQQPPTPASDQPDDGPAGPPAPPPAGVGLAARTGALDARVLFAEFLCTLLFVHLSVMACTVSPGIAAPFPNSAYIAAIAAAFLPVSGAHLNPAVTLALLVTRQVPPLRAAAFIPLQCAGALSGAALAAGLGASLPAAVPALPALLPRSALLVASVREFVPMFVIVCVVYLTAVASPKEGGVGASIAPLYIALSVLGCIVAFPTAVFNPARAFGPALLAGCMAHHWVFWVGSILGACCAALLCEHLFVAPAANRNANSVLSGLWQRYSSLANRMKSLGVAGVISYGILNILYYGITFSAMMMQVGRGSGAAGLAQAWLITWSFSQVTKPLRFGLAIFMAPFIDRWLSVWKKRKQ